MNTLRIIKRFLDRLLGSTKSDKLFWQFRHLIDKTWAQSYISNGSLNHSHRKLLIGKISKYSPFKNVLEVGSASGPNLYLLAEKFTEVDFYGIDVSEKAVRDGNLFFKKRNIKNVLLRKTDVSRLKDFVDNSMDVVFSDAVLLYVGLDKVGSVLKEMVRISKKAIILCEQHTDVESFYDDKWVHNYKKIVEKVIPQSETIFTKIPQEVWQGDWGEYGYIIEVIL